MMQKQHYEQTQNLQALHKQDYFQNLVVPQQFYSKYHSSLKYLSVWLLPRPNHVQKQSSRKAVLRNNKCVLVKILQNTPAADFGSTRLAVYFNIHSLASFELFFFPFFLLDFESVPSPTVSTCKRMRSKKNIENFDIFFCKNRLDVLQYTWSQTITLYLQLVIFWDNNVWAHGVRNCYIAHIGQLSPLWYKLALHVNIARTLDTLTLLFPIPHFTGSPTQTKTLTNVYVKIMPILVRQNRFI